MKLILAVLCCLLFPFAAFCQSVEDFIQNADSLEASIPVEKVHLHLDRPYYAAGQTIWLKAYVVDGANRPSMLSNILYVDLIGEHDRIIKALKLPLAAGLASSDIALADTLDSGRYRLRAYTQWMRNFGEEGFFNRTISIVNPFNAAVAKGRSPAKLDDSWSVQFFPEGGDLVDSIRSKVAFKVLGSDGLGVSATGYVLDEQGARVAEFASSHAGMGSFMLSPFRGQTYTAVVRYGTQERRISLPSSRTEGYVLSLLDEDDSSLRLRITASKGNMNTKVTLIAQNGGQAQLLIQQKLDGQFADIRLPKDSFTRGLARFTLLDDKGIPVAERLAFIFTGKPMQLDLTTNKNSYGYREKVKVEMNLPAESGLSSNFSVSVTDISRLPVRKEDEHSILSDLLIKSELQGYIEQPNYYFISQTAERRKELDNLLMTQGWRRVSAKDMYSGQLPKISFQAEKDIQISGRVLLRGQAVKGGKVTLFSPNGGFTADTLTDDRGRFRFDKLIFADSTRFVVQARQQTDRPNVQIRLDLPERQRISLADDPELRSADDSVAMSFFVKEVRDELEELIKQGLLSRTNMLKEVVVKAVKPFNYVENSSKLGNAPADFVLRADQFEGETDMGVALMGKIPAMTIQVDPKTMAITAGLMRHGGKAMRLFVDGADWGTDLSAVPPGDIATLEVIRNAARSAIYGNAGSYGLIIVTTKVFAGLPTEVIVDPQGIITYRPQGYTVSREFYSPDYDAPETPRDSPDLRTTIYWNPDIFSKDGQPSSFEFFTADKAGTYRMVVEGLDVEGRLGRKAVEFEVR